MSTSTTHTCVPAGQVKFGGSHVADEVRSGSVPAGRSCACQADTASSGIVRALSGAPRTEKVPRSNSRSPSDTSSSCAAIVRAFSLIFSSARCSAAPPTEMLRLP